MNLDVVLALDVDLFRVKSVALSYQDHRLDEIDSCDQLTDRMLDLDPCIHFDKVVVSFPVH